MNTTTKEKKAGARVLRRSYARLIQQKEKIDKALRLLVGKESSSLYAGREALLDMSLLKIKGGPHDLSGRLRDYLYGL